MKIIKLVIAALFISQAISAQLKPGWYKTFSGKIGNMEGVLHLVSSTDYQGYLWFKQNQYPMAITGQFMKTDSIQLSTTDGFMSITLTGIISKSELHGIAEVSLNNSPSKKGAFSLQADSSFTPFLELYSNTNTKLPPQLKSESSYSYFKGAVWPKENNSFSSSIKNIIKKAVDLKSTESVAAQLKSATTSGSKQWLATNSKLSQPEVSDMGFGLSDETQEFVSVMYENEKTITLAHYVFSYTGGAHGNYGTNLYPVLKSNGKILKLTDVLTEKGITELPKILDQVARVQYKIKSGSLKDNGFFVNHIPVGKEFYVTEKGIGFLYNPYEIMPFAAGQVNLLIPFSAIKSNVRPEFQSFL